MSNKVNFPWSRILSLLWESMGLWQTNLWVHIVILMRILLLQAFNHTYFSSENSKKKKKQSIWSNEDFVNQFITDGWLYWPGESFCILIIAKGKDRNLVASQNVWPCLFISLSVIHMFLDIATLMKNINCIVLSNTLQPTWIEKHLLNKVAIYDYKQNHRGRGKRKGISTTNS